jgi:hypothetical protein
MGSHHRITVVEWRQWCVYVCIVVCYETDLAGVVFREPLILLPFIFFFFNILYILEQIFFYYMQVVRERHKVERGLGIGGVGSFDGMRLNTRAAGTCAALPRRGQPELPDGPRPLGAGHRRVGRRARRALVLPRRQACAVVDVLLIRKNVRSQLV